MENMAPHSVRMLLCVVCAIQAIAQQNAAHSCEVPTRVLTLEQVQEKLKASPDDFHLLFRLLELTPVQPKPGPLAAMFEHKLAANPNDPTFGYLHGRALIGKDTPQAIVNLNRVRETDPRIPWTFSALANIYSSRNFRDNAKLLSSVRAYRQLCPHNLDGFRYLDKFTDTAETAAIAKELRPLLEANPQQAEYWPHLWAAEFRVTPPTEYDALREQVASDVRLRLEPLPATREQMLAIADGYRLTNRPDEAATLMRKVNPDAEMQETYRDWEAQHKLRSNNLKREDYLRIAEEQAKASAEWVAQWPDSRFAWQLRLSSLTFEPNWTKQQLEQAGEALLRADALHPLGWTAWPAKLRVAQAWVQHGIRLRDCVRIGQESLDSALLGPEVQSDLFAPSDAKEIDARGTFGFDTGIWDAMVVVLEASAQLKDLGRARAMLATMRKWLDDNVAKKDDRTSGYSHFQGKYLYSAGEIAEAEGHRLDAAALYARAVATGWSGSLVGGARPRTFWLEQGGTADGWALATGRLPVPAPPPPPQAKTAMVTPAPRAGVPGWADSSQLLPEMSLRDTAGRTWTLADFRGKPTFVNLWATWCAPCREELPAVQKLYELVKDRSDIQVVTLDLDENPGEVAPFLAAHKFTFPVILARPYIDAFLRSFTIPENWIVGRDAVIRQRSIGFEIQEPGEWPALIRERLVKLAEQGGR